MEKNNGRNNPEYSLQQLETYIQLSVYLTGEKPTSITLNPNIYEAHVQTINNQAEAMGLKPGFKDDKVTFLGIPLEKKVSIATATELPN